MWTENSFKITWTFSGDIRVNFKRPVWIWFYSYFSLRFLNGHITSFEKLCYGSQRNLDAMGAREALYWCNQGYRVKEILISWKSVFFTLWWRENFKEKKITPDKTTYTILGTHCTTSFTNLDRIWTLKLFMWNVIKALYT